MKIQVLPVRCLKGHRFPIDFWGQRCPICVLEKRLSMKGKKVEIEIISTSRIRWMKPPKDANEHAVREGLEIEFARASQKLGEAVEHLMYLAIEADDTDSTIPG